jgi:hypothetical protein
VRLQLMRLLQLQQQLMGRVELQQLMLMVTALLWKLRLVIQSWVLLL